MNKVAKNIGLALATTAVTVAGLAGAAAADDTSTSGHITLSSYGGRSGAVVTVKGNDFHAKEAVKIYLNQTGSTPPIKTVTTNKSGDFTTKITINNQTPYDIAKVVVSAEGGVFNENTGSYQDSTTALYNLESNDTQPTITLSQLFGAPGSQVVVSGGGFTPNEAIRVGFGNFAVVNTTSDQYGDFSATFQTPSQPGQSTTVNAYGGAYNDGTYAETASYQYQILDYSANANVSNTSVKAGSSFYFTGITYQNHGIVILNREDSKGNILSTINIEANYNGTYSFPAITTSADQAGKTLYYSVQAQGSSRLQQFEVNVTQ